MNEMDVSEGIVYILTNPAMPNLVKIGMTTRDLVDDRMLELYTTGVPVPFECSFAGKVSDVRKVERAFHKAFGPYRINPSREFFEIEDQQAIALLELLSEEDVTPEVKAELDQVDQASKEAGEKLQKKRRPNLNFVEMGIAIGSILFSNFNEERCTVLSPRTVEFRGEEMSLTRATKFVLDNDYNVAPGPYWVFEGETIRELYNNTYER